MFVRHVLPPFLAVLIVGAGFAYQAKHRPKSPAVTSVQSKVAIPDPVSDEQLPQVMARVITEPLPLVEFPVPPAPVVVSPPLPPLVVDLPDVKWPMKYLGPIPAPAPVPAAPDTSEPPRASGLATPALVAASDYGSWVVFVSKWFSGQNLKTTDFERETVDNFTERLEAIQKAKAELQEIEAALKKQITDKAKAQAIKLKNLGVDVPGPPADNTPPQADKPITPQSY